MEKDLMKNKNGQVAIIVAIIFGAIIIGGSIVYFTTNSGSGVTGDVTQENCREVDVPYNEQEQYTEQEPYQEIEYYDYYLNLEKVLAYTQEQIEPFGRGLYDEARVDIKNIDNDGGWVTVTFYWKTINKEWEETDRQFLEPGETVRFTSVYDKEAGEDTIFSYIYKSDPIEKTKYVTNYRDVTKYRTVTKYKTEIVCE